MESKEIPIRAYNRFILDEFQGTFTKYSDTEKLRNEVIYYQLIPNDLKIWFPRLLSCGTPATGSEAWLSLEYYDYCSLGDVMTKEQHCEPIEAWNNILVTLNDILMEWGEHKPYGAGWYSQIQESAHRMYIKKTEQEYKNLYEQLKPDIQSLFEKKELIINGAQFRNFSLIWPEIKEYVEKEIIPTTEICFIHGDCCFANILYSGPSNLLRFIDPRGSFGARGVWGDPRYDAAKLMHSADGGYEFLNNNQFVLTKNLTTAEYEYKFIGGDNKEISVLFDRIFFDENTRFDRKEITTIQGLLYISMAARHYENQERQIVQYLTGVELLNEVLFL